jgi:hypothetical protein
MLGSLRKTICILVFFLFFRCGTNTDTPVAPFVFLVPVGVPQIFSVLPSTNNTDESFNLRLDPLPEGQARPEYYLQYFITNREPQFVGYNLYITTATPSVAETLSGEFLEDGIPPSFPHLPIEESTESRRIITRKIKYQVPPPGLVPFQRCQIYNFTLRAMLNSGLVSNQGTTVSRCAAIRPDACPPGSGCNPERCTVANCDLPETCPVGTTCNPCRYDDDLLRAIGCPCQPGDNPPGCYR